MTLVPHTGRRGSSLLRIAIFGAWLAYGIWLFATGRLSTGEAVVFVVLVVAALGLLYLLDAWWNRPIAPPGEEHREWNAEGEAPAPRPVPAHSALDDLKFPAAIAAALVAVMVFLGFPGGGFGAGLVAIGAIGLLGWLALNRAIGGP